MTAEKCGDDDGICLAIMGFSIYNQFILMQHLIPKNMFTFKRLFRYTILTCLILGIALAFGITWLETTLPDVETLKDAHLQSPLRVFSADNKLIEEFGNIRRSAITLNQVPKQLIQATLATEDQRFFEHSGVDFFGLARAAVVLVLTGQKQQGGSTITMQVARNYFLTQKKTYTRKLKEILLAFRIDHAFTKEKVLELYFNKIFYGNHAYGIGAAAKIYYGKNLNELTLPQLAMLAGLPKAPSTMNPLVNPTAAKARRNHVLEAMYEQHYIDKATYLNAAQAPLTAKYHDLKISVHAPYVAEMVRQLMVSQYGDNAYTQGFNVYTTIDSQLQKAASHALSKNLMAYDHRHGYRGPEQNLGSPNLDNLEDWLQTLSAIPDINNLQPAAVLSLDDQSATALLKNGQTITVPWDGLSWARKQIMQDNQEYLGRLPSTASDVLRVGDVVRVMQNDQHEWVLTQIPKAQAAIVVLNPKNGAIEALDGGFNYYKNNFNHATQASRQPGSAFKPFIYSAALAKKLTLATTINDAPVVMSDTGENDLWRPENDTGKFYGPTRLRVALNKSRNLVSIRLLAKIGIPYTINYLTRFGFERDQLPPTLSLALGTANVTPLQLATAYAVFANKGFLVKPYYIDQIVNTKHQTIYRAQPLIASDNTDNSNPLMHGSLAPRVITPQNAYLMTSALQDVIKYGTARRALALRRNDIAGKTGTTNEKKDAWFSGYTPHLVATVWMGFDQPKPLYEYGAQAALPLWIDFIHDALKEQPNTPFVQPEGIVTARIDKRTGLLTSAHDADAMFELFDTDALPSSSASLPKNTDNTTDSDEPLY
ncbi:MAG: penicillin-binding protein 1A [Gammaproteobacteria bacterium]|nr:penicillin-binding protein 1A [Gammaproteobacteria bacterium]MBU1628741.1 penicillin-binding protein 1A [Gammaproteobacteria bacterium]